MPYRRATTLMRALLPLRRSEISYGRVRRATIDTGRRIETRALDPEEYEWESAGRTCAGAAHQVQVAIDGTCIRAAPGAYGRHLRVVAGRIERDGQLGGHFAWVPEATGATGAMMKSALDDDGLTSDSSLTCLRTAPTDSNRWCERPQRDRRRNGSTGFTSACGSARSNRWSIAWRH